jgi:hypothetical protein
MTDIDRLLTEDGARWRATQPAPPEPDRTRLTRPVRSRWQPLAAAAAVVAVAAGAIGVAAAHRSAGPPATPVASGDPGGALAPVDTVVRDGDRVRGWGLVVALPGRPVRLCSGSRPQARPDGGAVVVPRQQPGYCPVGVTLRGVDLARLTDREEQSGVVWGTAEITGVYRAGTVTVTAQGIRSADADEGLPGALPADCPVPAGGWPRAEVQSRPGVARAGQYVAAHPDVLGSLSIAYPETTPVGGPIATQVLLVGTTGDIGAATREIRRFYADALCVRRVEHSRSQMLAARGVIDAAYVDPAVRARYGLTGTGEAVVAGDPRVSMSVVVYTASTDGLRRRAGAGVVDVDPQLRAVS